MRKEHIYTFSLTNLEEDGESEKEATPNRISDYVSFWARHSFQRKNLLRKFPFLQWMAAYNVTKLIADLIAGLTLGLTTIPQVLGVANVAEIPPEYGLYSAFVGPFIYILLGSTKYITVGPTVTTAIVTLSYTKGQPPEFSVLLCFLSGVTFLLMSFLQLGFIVNLISKPVISGFTSAAAISITSTQLKSLLGLSFSANGFVEEISRIVSNITDTRWQDCVAALISLSSLYILMNLESLASKFCSLGPKAKKLIWILSSSRNVIVVVTATVIFSIVGEPSPVLLVGDVPSGMPPFKIPPFSYSERVGNSTVSFSLGSALREKTSALIVIPLIAFMEHVTITKAFAGTDRIDPGQELLALGVCNIIGSFFSSMPVTGAFGRTALNHASGAQSPLGGLITGAIIALALVLLTPQFYYIPKSTLSSAVVMAVIFMVDFGILRSLWRSKKLDLLPWVVTFFTSLLLGLEYGIIAGFAVSSIFLLYYAARPGIRVSRGWGKRRPFLWIEVDRSLTFPSVEYARYAIMKAEKKWGRAENNGNDNNNAFEGTGQLPVVIDCKSIAFADYTAAQGLGDILKLFKAKGAPVILWNVKPSIKRVWDRGMGNSSETKPVFCMNESDLEDEIEKWNQQAELHEKQTKKPQGDCDIENGSDNMGFDQNENVVRN